MAQDMPFDLAQGRRSMRLQEYNYTQAGAYFVTVCAQNHECLFGQVAGDEMVLNDAGRMVQDAWEELPHRFPTVDAYGAAPTPALPRRAGEGVCPPPVARGEPEGSLDVGAHVQRRDMQGRMGRGAINCAPTRNAVNRYDPEKHHRPFDRAQGRPFDFTQDRPFDFTQDRPFDFTQDRPFDFTQEYDYTQAGAYFVTVCAQNHECLFGEVAGNEMVLNDAGRMVQDAWQELPHRFPIIRLDEFVVMPNHFHAIVVITDTDGVRAPLVGAPNRAGTRPAPTGVGRKPALGDVIGAFKSITTNLYIRGVREGGWLPFDRRLWQRNYYERVVRNERELNAIRQYIRDNPTRWAEDEENPNRIAG
jgi:putative transposase